MLFYPFFYFVIKALIIISLLDQVSTLMNSAVKISNAETNDSTDIYTLINSAYMVEKGDTGISFKKTDRLLNPMDGLNEAYENNRIIKAELSINNLPVIVGIITWKLLEYEFEGNHIKSIYFGPFAVSPNHQGQGIGKLLLNEIDKKAKELNVDYLDIVVINHRSDLLPFYKKLGYVEYGTAEYPVPERLTRPSHFVKLRRPVYIS